VIANHSSQVIYGQLNPDDPVGIKVLEFLVDGSQDLYPRALAARVLSVICLKVRHAKAKLISSERWGQLVDTLLDLVGSCNEPRMRKLYTEGDRERIRRNLCVTLSILMDDASCASGKHPPPVNSDGGTKKRPTVVDPANSMAETDAHVYEQWLSCKMEAQPAKVIKTKKGAAAAAAASLLEAAIEAPMSIITPPPPPPSPPPTKDDEASIKDLMKHIKHMTPMVGKRSRSSTYHGKENKATSIARKPPPAPQGKTKQPPRTHLRTSLAEDSVVSSVTGDFNSVHLDNSLYSEDAALTTDDHGHRGPVVGFYHHPPEQRITKVNWHHNSPAPRPAVIFGENLMKETGWIPNTKSDDFIDKDRRLGYQV